MTQWSDVSRSTIERVALSLADDLPLKDRKAAIEAAYPFGPQAYWPRRAWLKARKAYLARWESKPLTTGLFANFPRDPSTGRPIIPELASIGAPLSRQDEASTTTPYEQNPTNGEGGSSLTSAAGSDE